MRKSTTLDDTVHTLFFSSKEIPLPVGDLKHTERDQQPRWKVLIVDDDEDIHIATQLVLRNFSFEGRRLELLSVRSGQEARVICQEQPDIALVLLDVVMETEDAGLEVVHYLREELKNRFIRIILRTGQPGQAPEQTVITEYDINDYMDKVNLTKQRLFTTMTAGLRSYRDLRMLDTMQAKSQRHYQRAYAINQLLSDTLQDKPLSEYLKRALELTLEGTWATSQQAGSIFLVDEVHGDLVLAVDKNLNEQARSRCTRVAIGQCLCGLAAARQKIVFSNDFDAHHDHDINCGDSTQYGHCCVPIKLKNQLLGIISLQIATDHSRNTDEERFLTAMADALAGIVGRYRSEERLKEKSAQLLHSGRLTALGEMATTIAHEVNQPLNYIGGCIQSLMIDIAQGSVDKKKWHLKLEKAYTKVGRIDQIIRRVRMFASKNEAYVGKGEESCSCSVHTAMENSLILFGKRLQYSGIRLELNVDKSMPKALIDSNHLEQVFINLFQNALYALGDKNKKPRMVIRAFFEPEEQDIVIRCSDNGTGIEKSVLKKIFEPFFTTKKSGEGTGLGLSIIYGIIKDHKGSIQCKSELGQGTTFTITLPTQPTPPTILSKREKT